IVFGGEGTIRSAAQASTMDGPLLIPLPGGTMNLLPKALYGDVPWETALLSALRDPVIRVVSGGKADQERFFIAAILGAPALWAKAREALREGDIVEALEEGKDAIEHLFDSKVSYRFNELHEGTAEAISVVCPLISTTLADDRQVLEAAVIDVAGAGEVIELATAAAFGQWRDSRNVAIVNTKHVSVSATSHIPVILDGETVHVGKELEIEFLPEAFRAIVPAA
ncbi:MAG TPA: diacylglycerol kinase family lipid kinase, partial [Candidatus Paceibacterota bacterium]|nr:diacylglycerol kinase family lipid kinase [Candidatus Paceibacterota bacterium]